MIGAGRLGRDQEKNQIDRRAIERVEVDRPLEPRENPEDRFDSRQLAVRNGDAVAYAGGAETLALQQRVEDLAGGQAGNSPPPSR